MTAILAIVGAAALALEPTVDPLERNLAARDAANDRAWAEISGRDALAAKGAAFKAALRARLDYPGPSARPVPARTVGGRDYGAFRVEKVMFESAPGAFVTALVFLPASGAPPYAGFLFIPGHAAAGKGEPSYLHTCELAARNGLAAMVYDPLGQGERSQGAGLRTADEHVRIGAYAALLGETTATYMMRDAVRAFDCFAGRSDIRADRVGVCGNSGGGTMAALFMAVDDRVKAAAPSCYLSSAREQLLACGPQDAEQNFFDEFSWGFNHAALILSAGCPVLINAAREDFFQIEGSRATHRLVKGVAAKASLPAGWYELSEAPGRHAMSKVHRERAVGFLLKHLAGVSREIVETETTDFARADTQVTPEGEVSKIAGFRSVYDELEEKFIRRGVSVGNAALAARESVRRERGAEECAAVLGTLSGPIVPGRRARLHLGGSAAEGEVTATLFADGARYRVKPARKGKRSYYERRQDDEVVAVDLYLAGRSLVCLRAAEILTLAAELERRTGVKPELVAEGRLTVPAKFAAAADPAAFAGVRYAREPKDWLDALRARDYLSFAETVVSAAAGERTATAPADAVPNAAAELRLAPGRVAVVIAPDAVETVRFAADEMTNFLARVLGAPVPIRTAPDPVRGTTPAVSIILGDNAWSRAAGIDVARLPTDAYRTVVVSNRIYIAGYDDPTADPWAYIRHRKGGIYFRRGTALGVYGFLDKYAHVRFYFVGEPGIVAPCRASVTVPEGDAVTEPAFIERTFSWWGNTMGACYDKSVGAEEWDRMKRLAIIRMRFGTQHDNTSHGLRQFRYLERFAAAHPDYLQMMADGKRFTYDPKNPPKYNRLCFSSAGLRDEIYADVKAYLTGQPASSRGLKKWERNCQEGRLVDIGPEDGYTPCHCPACQAAYESEKGLKYATRLIWDFYCDIAGRLRRDGIPGTLKVSSDYGAWTMPEGPIPDNVICDISVKGPWSAYDEEKLAKEVGLMRRWHEKSGRKNLLWTYVGKFRCAGLDTLADLPPVAPRGYAKFYRAVSPYTVGPYNETLIDRHLLDAINIYVLSKLTWNPDLDIERLLAEAHRDLFGAGAPYMAEFFDTLERLWTRIPGKAVDRPLGPFWRAPSEFRRWHEIYSADFARTSAELFDRAAAAVPSDSPEAARLALFRREIFEPLATKGAAYRANLSVKGELERRAARKPVNLIPGTPFQDLKKWRRGGLVEAIAIDRDVLLDGRPTLRIALAPSMTNRCVTGVRMPFAAERGKTYRVSYFVRGEDIRLRRRNAGANAEFWLDMSQGNGVSVPGPQYLEGTFDWIHQSALVTIPPDGAKLDPSISLRLINATGTVWFALPLVEEVKPTPAENESVRLARAELELHLRRATGRAMLPGWMFRFEKPGDEPEAREFESFYRVDDGTVWFWGDDRVAPDRYRAEAPRWGSLFAVSLFLERELGVRWLWPGYSGIVCPKNGRPEFTVGPKVRYSPPLEMSTVVNAFWILKKDRYRAKDDRAPVGLRGITREECARRIDDMRLFLLRHRLADRRVVTVRPAGDAFLDWGKRFGKTHPEYLNWNAARGDRGHTKRHTKLCVSNEAVVDQILADWCAAGTNAYLNVKENDCEDFCECAACRALDCPRPGERDLEHLTDRYLNYVNRVCRRARAIRPDVKVLYRIYSYYRLPPRRERLEYPENMLISYVPSLYDDIAGDLREWKAKGLETYLLRPNFLCYRGMVPRGLERVMYDCFRNCLTNGMVGVYYDTCGGRLPLRLETYATVRQIAEPEIGFERICDEYYAGFGAAAPMVRAYCESVRANGERARREYLRLKESEAGAFDDSLVAAGLQAFGRTEAELASELEILKSAEAASRGRLAADEAARLRELTLSAEHALLTYRFVAARGGEKPQFEASGRELIDYRRRNREGLSENWGNIFGMWSGEIRLWSQTDVWRRECNLEKSVHSAAVGE